MSAGAVASGGTIATSGAANMQAPKRTATTTLWRPVRAPSATPAADSTSNGIRGRAGVYRKPHTTTPYSLCRTYTCDMENASFVTALQCLRDELVILLAEHRRLSEQRLLHTQAHDEHLRRLRFWLEAADVFRRRFMFPRTAAR